MVKIFIKWKNQTFKSMMDWITVIGTLGTKANTIMFL
jgi:hypothetical protein